MFWNFTMLQYRSDLTQVKQNLIFSITNFVYKQRNIRKILNLGGDKSPAQSLLEKSNFGKTVKNNKQEQTSTFLVLSNFT